MRKHFLILMLFALLPLAGWAITETTYPVDLSDGWAIHLSSSTAKYTGTSVAPTITLVKDGYTDIPATKFNVQWSADPINVGAYTVTVTANDSYDGTYESLDANTVKFYVLKANSTAANGDAHLLQNGWTYSEGPASLPALTAAVTVDFGTVEYSIDYNATTKQGTWIPEIPTIDNVGTYEVYFRVQDDPDGNYNGIAPKKIIGNSTNDAAPNIVVIGTTLVETTHFTAPVGVDGLAVTWDDSKNTYASKALITAGEWIGGTERGKFMYSSKLHSATTWSAWSEDVPEASEAGEYDVKWMIEPNKGYYKVDETEFVSPVGIDRMAVTGFTVSNAEGKTELEYNKNGADPHQSLLSKAGSANHGASVLYKVSYKATAATPAWTPDPSQQAVANYADVVGGNAGLYQITTYVADAGNHKAKEAADPIVVTIAKAAAYTTEPSAKTGLTWNGDPQTLINAAAGADEKKVLYCLDTDLTNNEPDGAWVNTLTTIVGTVAGAYQVWWKVDDANYLPVEATKLNVTIAPQTISVRVNNASKDYDATLAINTAGLSPVANLTVDGGKPWVEFITPIEGKDDFAALKAYVALADDTYKEAGEYAGVLTVNPADLTAINTTKGYCYDYTILPGKLTVNKLPVTVTAKNDLTAVYGHSYDIHDQYTVSGILPGEDEDDVFETFPILTTDAAAVNPVPDTYGLSFTPGVLKNNYKMSDAGDEGDAMNGYVIGVRKFTVTEDPDAKIVITVLPHTQKYTGVADEYDWDNMEEGVDYLVSGLQSDDALTVKPKFKREKFNDDDDATNDKFDADTYQLTAYGADVADMSKYPGKIKYNNSTFTIEPAELVATVNPQTITTAETVDDLVQTAWKVTGMVNDEPQTELDGSLSITATAAPGDDFAKIGYEGVYKKGIKLTITNTNYILKANTEYGELRIIDPDAIELNDTKDVTEALIAANESDATPITFNSRTLTKDTWNTLILPFDIKVRDLSNYLGYAVVDMLDKSNTDPSKVIFKVATGTIDANTPFMVKTDEDVNLQDITFETNGTPAPATTIEIAYTATTTCEVADKAGNKLTGAYKSLTVNKDEYYMNGEGNWKLCGKAFNLKGERVKFTKAAATSGAPIFYIEEGDGTMTVINGETTSIETISAEKLNAAEGWYTLNGVKLQSVPTQKGIYINNGKKVVIK